MSVRTDVLLWAQRVLAKGNAPAHTLLEVRENAPADVVSDAFQKIARMAHPDLHRNGLSPEELEQVTSAYSRVAGAYQEMRSQRMTTTRIKPIGKDETASSIVSQRMSAQIGTQSPASGVPVAEAPAANSGPASHSMNSKALIYYRKAELALRRGDLKGGILQIKLAIAADPGSQFLRQALGQIEAELAKAP
jgi:hypothetical protein